MNSINLLIYCSTLRILFNYFSQNMYIHEFYKFILVQEPVILSSTSVKAK